MTGKKKQNDIIDRMAWGQENEYRGVAAVEAEQGVLFSNTGKRQRSHLLDAGGYVCREYAAYNNTADGFYVGVFRDLKKTSLFMKGEYEIRATPDGLFTRKDGDRTGLEVKCPQNLHEELREIIICQVQFQCFVCDLKDATVLEWTFNGHRAWYVKASSVYIHWAMPMVDEFMAFVRDDLEPPKRKYPTPPGVEKLELFHEEKEDVPF